MARSQTTQKTTRIQRQKKATILDAALDVFAGHGFRGATIDMIATAAGMSKPNILYYFDSKEAIHRSLLEQLLENWLEPLKQLDPAGQPVEEICTYIAAKMEMSRDFPKESALFANEILRGAPAMLPVLKQDLKQLVDEKADVIQIWVHAGALSDINPHHLIFMIWATTQHYADFEVQVQAVTAFKDRDAYFEDAKKDVDKMFRKLLSPS